MEISPRAKSGIVERRSPFGGSIAVVTEPSRWRLGRVSAAVKLRDLRRWLLAIVVILGIGTVIAGASETSTSASMRGDLGSVGKSTTASGPSGTEGIVPVRARVERGSGLERGARAKIPLLVGPVATALAAVTASRRKLDGHHSCRLSLAQRAWSVRRRGPPLLALG